MGYSFTWISLRLSERYLAHLHPPPPTPSRARPRRSPGPESGRRRGPGTSRSSAGSYARGQSRGHAPAAIQRLGGSGFRPCWTSGCGVPSHWPLSGVEVNPFPTVVLSGETNPPKKTMVKGYPLRRSRSVKTMEKRKLSPPQATKTSLRSSPQKTLSVPMLHGL